MKKVLITIAVALVSMVAAAQNSPLISWTTSVEKTDAEDIYRVTFTGKIAEGYHTYTLDDEFSATEIVEPSVTGGELVGKPYETGVPVAIWAADGYNVQRIFHARFIQVCAYLRFYPPVIGV